MKSIPKYKYKFIDLTLVGILFILLGCKNTTKEKELVFSNNESVSKRNFSFKNKVYTTAHNTDLKLTHVDSLEFRPFRQPKETEIDVVIDPSREFQTLLGIGAALTDASAETFYKLSTKNQDRFLKAYYDKEDGIGYSLARTIIHSCDFSPYSYTYIEEGDETLTTFNIDHDREFRMPFIKKVLSAAGKSLPLYVSPWSPPAFMKTNNNMLQGGKLKKEYYDTWAKYYAKFIKAYEDEGIPIWGLTIQNEPMAVQRWESCIYTAEEERDFLKYHLGPTLHKEGLGDKKIIVWDHNRDLLFQRANVILNDTAASKYVWGVGFHWYEDWKDGVPMFHNVGNVYETYPDKKLIFTEGCNEGYDLKRIEEEDPKLAERYGKSMINDFNNGTVAWTDWNILLDENGGPNHVGNLCFAPVHGDTTTGELTFTYSYYYIGHFSKFIRPGAKRINSISSSNSLLSTAFNNIDGTLAAVVMNPTENTLNYSITLRSKSAHYTIPAHGIQTIIFE